MDNLDKIHEYVNESVMILIINNNSKSLLNALYNLIYNKYPLQKSKCDTGKQLFIKLMNVKNKLLRIEFDFAKVQFSSTNNSKILQQQFVDLKPIVSDNNAKLLFKTNLSLYKEMVDLTKFFYNLPQYNVFDLVILIDKKDIKILKNRNGYNTYRFNKSEDGIININTLLRNTKLKQLQKKLNFYEKES